MTAAELLPERIQAYRGSIDTRCQHGDKRGTLPRALLAINIITTIGIIREPILIPKRANIPT